MIGENTILIYEAPVSELLTVAGIRELVCEGYKKTGQKFWVHFAGSKGYLSHFEISAEGGQPFATNRGVVSGHSAGIARVYWHKDSGVILHVEVQGE